MNILIKNTNALIYNDNAYTIKSTDICIKGDSILCIGNAPADFKAQTIIDGADFLAMPGLINCHTHSYMSLLRSVGDDMAFSDWLFGNIEPRENKMQPDDAYWGACLAILEMMKSGTTCFCDMQMHIGKTTKAAQQSGMRAVISRGLVGSGNDQAGQTRMQQAFEEIEMFKNCDRLTFMLGPHAPYSCDDAFLQIVAAKAFDKKLGIHMHLSESRFEVEECIKKYGCTPIALAEKTGIFKNHTLAAHCVHLTDDDIDIIKQNNVNVVTCPASNAKLGNGYAPVEKLLNKGVNVCLGTDGAASNNSLNLFRELGLLTLMHKGKLETPQCISAVQGLSMVTQNAAKAVGLNGITGVLQSGMKADIALLCLNTPSLMPRNNLTSSLCYSATGAEVDTVIINGQITMQNRQIKTLDEERIYSEVARICKRLNA